MTLPFEWSMISSFIETLPCNSLYLDAQLIKHPSRLTGCKGTHWQAGKLAHQPFWGHTSAIHLYVPLSKVVGAISVLNQYRPGSLKYLCRRQP
jgi:hypothetical protein